MPSQSLLGNFVTKHTGVSREQANIDALLINLLAIHFNFQIFSIPIPSTRWRQHHKAYLVLLYFHCSTKTKPKTPSRPTTAFLCKQNKNDCMCIGRIIKLLLSSLIYARHPPPPPQKKNVHAWARDGTYIPLNGGHKDLKYNITTVTTTVSIVTFWDRPCQWSTERQQLSWPCCLHMVQPLSGTRRLSNCKGRLSILPYRVLQP